MPLTHVIYVNNGKLFLRVHDSYSYSLFFKVHKESFWAPALKSPAENGISKKSEIYWQMLDGFKHAQSRPYLLKLVTNFGCSGGVVVMVSVIKFLGGKSFAP